MRNRDYTLESVDNALRLLLMLQHTDGIRLTDAATELGVARSTAHRLLTTMVRRGFVEQDDGRRYVPGPALRPPPTAQQSMGLLRAAARAHLADLVGEFNETAHLLIRDGSTVRFLDSVEATQPLHVGSRVGVVHPAHQSSGGQALLAELSGAEVGQIYRQITDPPPLPNLLKTLAATRQRGYGVNIGLSERGMSAIGVAVRRTDGRAIAALTISAPSMRLPRYRIPQMASALRSASQRIGGMAETPSPPGGGPMIMRNPSAVAGRQPKGSAPHTPTDAIGTRTVSEKCSDLGLTFLSQEEAPSNPSTLNQR